MSVAAGRGARRVALWLCLCLLGVAGCAPVRLREDAAGLRAQAQREAQLAPRRDWSLQARLAVSDGQDGGSGELSWHQAGDRFDFSVRAPVTGKTWRLHGDARGAVLEGVREQALAGGDAADLLERELGWHVPVAELSYWVRALRAPGTRAVLLFDVQGLPAQLEQAGWRIEYRDWFADGSPPLPRKVFASRGKYRVRLAVEQWQAP